MRIAASKEREKNALGYISLSVEQQLAACTLGKNSYVQPIVVYIDSDTSDHN